MAPRSEDHRWIPRLRASVRHFWRFWCLCRGRVRLMRPRDRLLWRRVDVVMKLLVDGAMLRLLPMDMTLELAIDEIERQLAIARQLVIERLLEFQRQPRQKQR